MRNLQLLSALLLGSAVFAGAQESQRPTPQPGAIDTKAAEKNKNTDAVYGRIKTVTSGDKIVIAVDNAPDKTYNLRDSKVTVRVAEGLEARRAREGARDGGEGQPLRRYRQEHRRRAAVAVGRRQEALVEQVLRDRQIFRAADVAPVALNAIEEHPAAIANHSAMADVQFILAARRDL